MLNAFFSFVHFFCRAQEPGWKNTWPFGPGWSEGWESTVLKFLLIAVILGGISLLLRFLFGPGGPMRPREFDEPDDRDGREGDE